MFGVILKATNSSFQKGMPFCHSIRVKKLFKLLAFIFEQSAYITPTNFSIRFLVMCNVYIDVGGIKSFTNFCSPVREIIHELKFTWIIATYKYIV